MGGRRKGGNGREWMNGEGRGRGKGEGQGGRKGKGGEGGLQADGEPQQFRRVLASCFDPSLAVPPHQLFCTTQRHTPRSCKPRASCFSSGGS